MIRLLKSDFDDVVTRIDGWTPIGYTDRITNERFEPLCLAFEQRNKGAFNALLDSASSVESSYSKENSGKDKIKTWVSAIGTLLSKAEAHYWDFNRPEINPIVFPETFLTKLWISQLKINIWICSKWF